MRKSIYTKFILLLFVISVCFYGQAQVDRTKVPEIGEPPKIELESPEDFKLDNGMKVLVVEDNVLPRVSYQLRIDNNPILEGEKAGVSSLLGAMLGNGTTTISKDKFNEEIDFMGASLSFGSQSAFASGLSRYSERLMQLMADAAINPLFSQEEFEKEKAKLIENLKSNEKSVSANASRVVDALSFGTDHPYGEFLTEETVNNVTLQDVEDYYKKYFKPNNAYLVIIGDMDDDVAKRLTKKFFGQWKASAAPNIAIKQPKPNVDNTQIAFVDMPNAVQSDITITNNVKLKMSDEDYHAVLLANFILGGGGSGYLYKNLREDKGYTYGAYSRINDSRFDAGRFSASAEVRNEVTDSAVVEALKEIKRIRTEKVTQEELDIAKAKYAGNFVLALERPQTIANYALNIELNDLDDDFYKDYLKKINAVTVDDIQRVANKYFKPENARIVVAGKGSEVLENLEKTGIPIIYYDRFANQIEKPSYSKEIPDGITAQSILADYIQAVGGKEKLSEVKSIYSSADVTIKNVPMKIFAEMKSMVPNKESMEMSVEGMGVMMKQKFDGEKGYTEQQGQKMELGDEEIAAKKAERSIFPELHYTSEMVSLDALTTIEGENLYKIKVKLGDKESFRYYDAETGLLKRVETPIEAQGQKLVSIVSFDDYQEVNGILMPMKQHVESGPQIVDLQITSVSVNENVTEEDFK